MRKRIRQAVADRARNYCEYCRSPGFASPGPFEAEHIHPRFLGGTNAMSNLGWSCGGCNLHKATAIDGVDPFTGDTFPLFHPRRQKWLDHFTGSGDKLRIVPLTGTGRVTVERLRLNRPELIILRLALRELGTHPPDG